MKNLFKLSFILLIISLNISCSKNYEENKKAENSENPEDLYKLAMLDLNNKNYDLATSAFAKIENKFPLSHHNPYLQVQKKNIILLVLLYLDYIEIYLHILKQHFY